LARHLRYRGLKPRSTVAMLLPRSPEAYAAILGILKAGCAYVPIDPRYPASRIAFILEDSRAAGLVTTAELAWQFAGFGGVTVSIDEERSAVAIRTSAPLSDSEVAVDRGDPCYVIYTSGSTGRPKGVIVEHRSAAFLVNAEAQVFDVTAGDRVFQGASLCFDLSVEEMWLAFRRGAALVAATPAMEGEGAGLSRLLTECRVTVFSTVPTILSTLTEDIPSIHLLILGGETCPPELVARWARPGRRIVNTYGPTETTVTATFADLVPGKPVTIGRPLPGCTAQLLDDHLHPVAAGAAGEICIGGPGVARGYVGLPGETRSRFILDPAAPHGAPRRLYRTGDVGRLNSDGEMEFLGRADRQVKLRGFRIELAEVEEVMLESGSVRAAACAVRRDYAGRDHLVGYVVPNDRRPLDEEALRAYLRGRLPSFMLPSVITSIDSLPRPPAGKLDRPALQPRKTSAAAERCCEDGAA
ncbi:MAG TPA: amino acid adenylation domain-containing protein, partial [Spirochaetia bacterium]|nr:amino acid adenylation domain-containing protein [Spirochaetia bacterium]